MKILIADDQLACRVALQVILEPYGECLLVEDGALAVQAFEAALSSGDPFRLVLLDINMPNMGGQEALLQIRRVEAKLLKLQLYPIDRAIIFMQTSVEDLRQLATAYIKGQCNGYITKPVDKAELLERLVSKGLV